MGPHPSDNDRDFVNFVSILKKYCGSEKKISDSYDRYVAERSYCTAYVYTLSTP